MARTPPRPHSVAGHDGQVKQGEQEILHARDSVGQTSGATPRGLKPGCSERIGNSRRVFMQQRRVSLSALSGQGGISRPAGADWRAALPTGHGGVRRPRRCRTAPSGMRQHAPMAGFPITTQRPYPSSAATGWAAQLRRSSGLRRRPINGTLRGHAPDGSASATRGLISTR